MIVTRRRATPLLSFLLLCGTVFVFLRGDAIADAVKTGLSLCALSLIPSLFPFMILSDLWTRSRAGRRATRFLSLPVCRLFGIGEAGAAAWLCGTLFGFPFGARAVAEGYRSGEIGKAEAKRLLLFCQNASPAFVIGSVGGMLGSPEKGVLLFLIEVLLSVAVGLLTRKRADVSPVTREEEKTHGVSLPSFSLPDAVRRAVPAMLFVCGCVLLFSAVGALTLPFLPDGFWRAAGAGIWEIGSACGYTVLQAPEALRLPLCGWAIGFSGVSVHLQGAEALDSCGVSVLPGVLSKALQGCAAFLLLFFFTPAG